MTPNVPHLLFDTIISEFKLKNDAGLAVFLGLAAPHVSRLRRGRFEMSGDIILRVYDKTGWSIETIRNYLRGPE